MEDSKVCSNCGSKIAATAAFCNICGAKVEPVAAVEDVTAAAESVTAVAENVTDAAENMTAAAESTVNEVSEKVENLVEESKETMENTPVTPVETQPAAPVEAQPAAPVETQPVTPVQTHPVTPVPVPVQPVQTPAGQPVPVQPVPVQPVPAQPVYAQPVYQQPAQGYAAPGYGTQGPAAQTPAPKKKKVGPLAYIFGSVVSLIEIVILFVLELIVVLRVGADDDVIKAAAERGDLGSDFLNEIAKVLPSLSHYIFIGIVGALCLAFAVLIFVIFSRRPALAFRTLAVDMLTVSGLYAFGMLFLNTYCGLMGSFNIDSSLMTLLRTTCSESVLLISLILLAPAIIFLIIAAILDSARYKKAVKASENK